MNLKLGILMLISTLSHAKNPQAEPLPGAPQTIEKFAEIATQYNETLPDLWNSLKPQERVFAYYMTRASIPGNQIYADQLHRDAVEIIALFERIITNQSAIREHCNDINVTEFLAQAELFAVYLFAHHSQYFAREFEDHKRTPAKLNLHLLTPENITRALVASGLPDAQKTIARLHDPLFNTTYEPTVTVEGSIEKSAVNMYGPDFTEADFNSFDLADRSALNAYFYNDNSSGKTTPKMVRYKIGGKYSPELSIARNWIMKAAAHAQQYPKIFDEHIPKSLQLLLRYLESGDEEDFRKFSIEWLRTKSRIDFNFGFVEVYQDPKQYRGSFEADVTIKAVDMAILNALLPSLERQLPFPAAYMRQNLDDPSAIPNASVNAKIFASGEAGPVKITAAYCLPNYADIRAQYGSKQIIYQQGKGLADLINPTLARRLFMSKEHVDWLEQNDPDGKLEHVMWDVHVLLHETMGHGSGRPSLHTFVPGDPMTIDGTTYQVGDTIEVSKENINQFLGNYFSGLEELRAEIIALYTSIFNFDELAANGLYKDWPEKIGKEKIIEWSIIYMARDGLRRLLSQKDDAHEIVQAHAQANTTILNYLLDHGGLVLVEEALVVENKTHTVIDLKITDLPKTVAAVKELALLVQTIKSTADGHNADVLMKNYGTCVRHPHYIKILKENRQAIQGDLKEVAEIFPKLVPVVNDQGTIVDISAQWPSSFLEQQLELRELARSVDSGHGE